MKARKTLLLALVLSLVMSIVLAGCGKKEEKAAEGGSSDNAIGADGKIDPSKLKPYNLKIYMIGPEQKDHKLVMEKVNEYTKEKLNATVEMKMIDYGDYDKKMQVITASGEPYDIAFTASWSNDFRQNVAKGAFMELDDLLVKYGKGTVAALDPRFLQGTKINGKTYAISVNKELGQQWVWRFNKQYVDKYNLDYKNVHKLEDLEPLLKTIKEKEPELTPLAVHKGFKPDLPFDYIMGDDLPFVMYLDTKDYKIVNALETPEMKQALETMHKYYKAGYLRQDVATLESIDNIKTGKWLVDREITQPYAEKGWSRSAGYEIVTSPMHEPTIFTQSAAGAMHAISVKSGDPERAMMFIELLNTDPYLRNLINYGIEGTHYKKVDDTTIEDLPAMKERYQMPGFALGNMMITYLHQDEPKDKWEQFKKFNESSKDAPTLGFAFDVAPVKNEMAAVKNVQKEFSSMLYTGSVDPNEYLPKAIQKYKDAGLDKIITEMQKQFDEWKKNNSK